MLVTCGGQFCGVSSLSTMGAGYQVVRCVWDKYSISWAVSLARRLNWKPLFYLKHVCKCACVYAHVPWHAWDNFRDLVLSFYHVGPGTELKSSVLAVHIFICWAISLVPSPLLFKKMGWQEVIISVIALYSWEFRPGCKSFLKDENRLL